MPLTINVGLSRKSSENYNSAGTSINLTAELDQSLLARPRELQNAISELYREAESALDRQSQPAQQEPQRSSYPQRSNGNGNGRNSTGGITQSQRKAIDAIGKRLDLDVTAEARHEFGVDLNQMSVREASQFIDHLKSLQSSGNNTNPHPNGNRR